MSRFFTIYGGNIEVFLPTDDLDFDFKSALKKMEKILPYDLISGIDVIYIGDFDILDERELNAAYSNGAIYVTLEQDSEKDFIDDIIHETAHSLEERLPHIIYDDGRLKNEFEDKYIALIKKLKKTNYHVPKEFTENFPIEYNEEWDECLHQTIGYGSLRILTLNIFCSPYGATDLREYWANCFEYYFLTSASEVAKICPVAYEKIKELHDRTNEN